jgi:hypothetical protein
VVEENPFRKPLGELIARLSNPDRFRRAVAVQQLVENGRAGAWPSLSALRDDPFWAVRLEVVRGTFCLGVPTEEAVPLLRHFLDDPDSLVRRYAKWTLENWPSGALPQLEGSFMEEELSWWGPTWNTSRDDPWWRDWLTSQELYAVLHDRIPRVGTPIRSLQGGTVFDYDSGRSCRVEAWIAPAEIVVAYCQPLLKECGPHEFEGWIADLRHSEPLELGRVRGRSSYGAACPDGSLASPRIKWAQAGDWAAMARNWHLEELPHPGSEAWPY